MRNLPRALNVSHLVCVYPAIEVLNFPPGGRGKREQPIKSLRSTAKYAVYFHHLLIATVLLLPFKASLARSTLSDEKRQHYV